MSGILQQINSPDDIKKLSKKELYALPKELRKFLLKNVSKTGGHVASNLGVVELTIALEYCFNLPKDKIVWDVGHQTYIHKILTGRRDEFHTLRQLDGISGFPKPHESPCDPFATGHSATSISAAFGLAKARDLKHEHYSVLAVIGDGSITGGLAYEALNHAGRENTDLIVILNDNEMSIDTNVGALSEYLSKLRVSDGYQEMKNKIRQVKNVPGVGEATYQFLDRVKDSAKSVLIKESGLFEALGFRYIGPVNGHDLDSLINVFTQVKKMHGPILIHVKTVKGKGYGPAEKDPSGFHGTGSFDLKTGAPVGKSGKPDYSAVFGRKLLSLAKKDSRICAITAAMASGTGLSPFRQELPDRFFDVAIAEQHGVTFSAALAAGGMLPVFAVYSTFLQRGYDELVHDACLENLHAIFAIDRAGVVGSDGETHQGIFDLSYLSHLPNMTILSPKNGKELEEMLEFAIYHVDGPVAVRYPRGTASEEFSDKQEPLSLGKAEVLQEGEKIAILAEGHMCSEAVKAAKILEEKGYHPMVVNMRFIKPLDLDLLRKLAEDGLEIFTVEDNLRAGGLGSKVLEAYSDMELLVKVHNFGFPDRFIEHGTQAQLLARYGLDGAGIAARMEKILEEK